MSRILLTDGNERATLAAARSLTRAGHHVYVTAPTRLSLAGASRGVRPCTLPIDPLREPAAYAAALGALARREDIDVLVPITDASVETVLEHRTGGAFHDVAVPFPDVETYRAASDKAAVLPLAQASGFGVPETCIVTSAADDDDLPDAGFFPAVIKPHRSVVTVGRTRHATAVTSVADRDTCRRTLAKLPPAAFPVLVQRHVAGVGEGFFALRWGGRTVAMFAHRRLREKPPGGGVSVYRESIALDDGLAGPGRRLLEALDWQGVAMVECRREAGSGRQVLMEINGRFWGSLQLAIDAGVDFPALLIRCAAGETVPVRRDYRVGVRSRWFWGDVDHLYLRWRNGRGGKDSRFAALRDFLRMRPGRDVGEVWRWRDPVPFMVETMQWLRWLPRQMSRPAPVGPGQIAHERV